MNWRRFVPALVLLFAAECEAQNQLPRYHFEVGQELVYRGGSELKSDKITLSHRHSWHVWVVRANSDGSWRLLLRHGDAFSVHRGKTDEDDKRVANNETAQESMTFGWCDIFSDGRIVENDSLSRRLQPAKLLPRLPHNQLEADRGWEAPDKPANETLRYRILPEQDSNRWTIEEVAESPQNMVFDVAYPRPGRSRS